MGKAKNKHHNIIPEHELAIIRSTKSESYEHKLIKKYLRIVFPLHNAVAFIKEESYLGDHIADLHIKLLNGNDVAVEVQSSYISPKEIIKRNKFYSKNGIYVIWILYTKGDITEFDVYNRGPLFVPYAP